MEFQNPGHCQKEPETLRMCPKEPETLRIDSYSGSQILILDDVVVCLSTVHAALVHSTFVLIVRDFLHDGGAKRGKP